MNDAAPSNNGSGRAESGRFGPGNRFGRGNPFAQASAKLRSHLMQTLTGEDIDLAVNALRTILRDKDTRAPEKIAAARELLDRGLGKPIQSIEQELAVIGEQPAAVDLNKATPEEIDQLRAIRQRIAARRDCQTCTPGKPCKEHQ